MLQVYYFTTAGWGGTGDLTAPVEQNTLWGTALVRRGLTLDQCLTACNPTEVNPVVISPDPDAAEFRDAAGFRRRTVTVPLEVILTINKSITLAGGAYRLRLDGGGSCYISSASNAILFFSDCDFVNITIPDWGSLFHNAPQTICTRCLFANLHSSSQTVIAQHSEFTDCAFIGCWTTFNGYKWLSLNSTFRRCTFFKTNYDYRNSFIDCVNTQDTAVNVFVSPPPSDWTDFSDWEKYDLHVLSTSSASSGNTLTSADGVVYDLAGNKRKVGGAKGAYEVLDDVTHWSRVFIRGWKYTVEYESDDAPVIVSIGKSQNRTSTRERTLFSFRDYAFIRFQYLSSSNAWTTISESQTRYVNTEISITLKKFRVTNDSGAYAYITLYAPNDTAPSNAQVCNMNISLSLSFANQDDLAASSVTANSVCYVDNNTIYADSASTVKKVYISGWTHVDLGDVTTTDSLVLGLGATVETSGNLTLKNETTTSETSGVIDAGGGVLTMQPGAAIAIDGGSFSGVLPPKITLANDVAITATGDGAAVVFGADYELPSASTLTLTGGSLTATSATISGTLTTDGTDITATGTLTNDGTLTIDGGDLSIATLTGTTIAISCATATGDSWGVSTLTTTGAASVATLTSSGVVEVGTSATGTTWNVASLSATSAIVTTLTSSGAVEIENESNGETWSATTLTSGACNVDDLTTTGNATINGAATGVDWEIGGALSVPNDAANITTLTAEAVSCDSASGTTWTVASLTTENAANVSSLTTTDAAQIGGDATGSIWSVASLTCAAAEVENLTSTGDVATTENATGDEWECAALDVGGTLDVGVLTATNVESVDAATGTTWDVTTLTAPSATITTLNASGAVAITGDASGSAWSTGNLTIGGAFSVATLALNGASSVPLESVSTLTLGASGALTISENSTVANLTTTDGATITFVDGVFLSATTEATLGETTLDGLGYFALPPETTTTDLTQADGADVRVCEFGAGVTSLSMVEIGDDAYVATWTKTNQSATVLFETLGASGQWVLVDAKTDETTANVASQTARVFDGEQFTESEAYIHARAYELAADIPVGIRQNSFAGGSLL